jgi:hypothetical protein
MPEMDEILDSEAENLDDENDDYLHCLELILLQICKSVRLIYFCLCTRLVWH